MNDRFFRMLAGLAATVAGLGVIAGAFGAHALKSRLMPDALDVLKTGVLYLFIHAVASIALAGLSQSGIGTRWLKLAGIAFMLGIFLFSGSLFLLSTREVTGLDIRAFGWVTPLGGLSFILGWASLAYWGLAFRNR